MSRSMQLIDGMKHSIYTQQTRLRQNLRKEKFVIARNLCSERAFIRRKFNVQSSKCRDFTQILADFLLNSYNRRNIIMKTLQQGYFTAFLRKKRVRAQAYATMCVDFLRF